MFLCFNFPQKHNRMLSMKVEPGDIPTWEKERTIIQEGYTRCSENTGTFHVYKIVGMKV